MDLVAYRALFATTPAPTPTQIDDFVAYVAGKHSWYKHLPLFPPGVDFVVYLDPGAGMERHARRADPRPFARSPTTRACSTTR
jgi:hypothetical protein